MRCGVLAQSAKPKPTGTEMAHGQSSEGMMFAPPANRMMATTHVVGASTAHSSVPSASTRTRAECSSSCRACSACLSMPKPPPIVNGPKPAMTTRATSGRASGAWPWTWATER